MPEPRLVLVTWRDAYFDLDVAERGGARDDYVVTTVGFLITESPLYVSIAAERLPEGEGWRAVTHIPRSVIQDVIELERREL